MCSTFSCCKVAALEERAGPQQDLDTCAHITFVCWDSSENTFQLLALQSWFIFTLTCHPVSAQSCGYTRCECVFIYCNADCWLQGKCLFLYEYTEWTEGEREAERQLGLWWVLTSGNGWTVFKHTRRLAGLRPKYSTVLWLCIHSTSMNDKNWQ